MRMLKNPMFHRQIIMDHYENPRNKREEASYPHKHMDSDSCIDDITVYVKVREGVIEDIAFEGTGCTISMSSTSIMTELMMHKTLKEAFALLDAYDHMIGLEDFDEDLLKEAVVFQNVGRQANRIQCATLGWRGLRFVLNEAGETHVK